MVKWADKIVTFLSSRIKWTNVMWLLAFLHLANGADVLVDKDIAQDVVTDQDAYIAEDLDESLVNLTHEEESLRDVLKYAASKALAGGIPGLFAGALQVSMLMWLRTSINYQYTYGVKLRVAVRRLYKEGGIKRFYKGITFAIIQGPLSRYGGTAANTGVQLLLRRLKRPPPLFILQLLGAYLAGAWRYFLSPIDTCKVCLQVQGAAGFKLLCEKVKQGKIWLLYQGAIAAALTTGVGHYPWFLTYNILSERVPRPASFAMQLLRNAGIGFICSVVADVFANVFRIAKATKQATAAYRRISYQEIYSSIYKQDGWKGVFGRGLKSRILVNSIQNIFFTVIWRIFHEAMFPHDEDHKK